MTVHTVASLLGLLIVAAVWVFTVAQDTTCEPLPARAPADVQRSVTRVVAITFAGTPRRVMEAADACGGSATSDAIVAADHHTLRVDGFLIATYSTALALACLLGWRIARRSVTRAVGVRLAIAVSVVALFDLGENAVLWRVVEKPATVAGWLIGVVTALAVTRMFVLALAAVYAIGAVIGGIGASGRARYPAFPAPLEPALRGPRGRTLEEPLMECRSERFEHLDGAPPGAVGLCLSGGGIRAASFALGVIQGIGSLAPFRYLATVSGGGYTGMANQLTHMARTMGLSDTSPSPFAPMMPGSPEAEYVTTHARYLWPPTSTGCWSSTKTFFRVAGLALGGIFVNASLLVGLLFVVAHPFGWLLRTWVYVGADNGSFGRIERWWQVLALFVQSLVAVSILKPILFPWWKKCSKTRGGQVAAAVLTTAAGAACNWLIVVVDEQPVRVFDVPVSMALMFVLLGALLWASWAWASHGRSGGPGFGLALAALGLVKIWVDSGFHQGVGGDVRLHLWAAPKALGVVMITLLVLAAMRLLLSDAPRRRLVAISVAVLAGSAFATLRFTFVALPDITVQRRGVFLLVATVVLGGIGAVQLLGLPTAPFEGSLVNAARTTIGLIAGLFSGALSGAYLWRWTPPVDTGRVDDQVLWLVLALVVTVACVRLDQRRWSPHGFYARRLLNTFSPVRTAGGGAGPLRDGTIDLPTWAARVPGQPQLLVCAAAYDTNRIEPAFTQALPFVFTDRYIGSPDVGFAASSDMAAALGAHARDVDLHAAAAISGAAVSPALGAVRLAALSQVFAFFNLRLGVWLPNPPVVNALHREVEDGAPEHRTEWVRRRRVGYLLRELASRYDTENRFIYVTDGGQFENLGMYALLARKCDRIYAFDASGDSPFSVSTLLESMALCHRRLGMNFGAHGSATWVDLSGIESPDTWKCRWESALLGDLTAVVPSGDPDWADLPIAPRAVAVFTAWYPPELALAPATIVFGKARLARNLGGALPPDDVRPYACSDRKFPSNSTGDQFIDPSQFQAYVSLGRWVAEDALASAPMTG